MSRPQALERGEPAVSTECTAAAPPPPPPPPRRLPLRKYGVHRPMYRQVTYPSVNAYHQQVKCIPPQYQTKARRRTLHDIYIISLSFQSPSFPLGLSRLYHVSMCVACACVAFCCCLFVCFFVCVCVFVRETVSEVCVTYSVCQSQSPAITDDRISVTIYTYYMQKISSDPYVAASFIKFARHWCTVRSSLPVYYFVFATVASFDDQENSDVPRAHVPLITWPVQGQVILQMVLGSRRNRGKRLHRLQYRHQL